MSNCSSAPIPPVALNEEKRTFVSLATYECYFVLLDFNSCKYFPYDGEGKYENDDKHGHKHDGGEDYRAQI